MPYLLALPTAAPPSACAHRPAVRTCPAPTPHAATPPTPHPETPATAAHSQRPAHSHTVPSPSRCRLSPPVPVPTPPSHIYAALFTLPTTIAARGNTDNLHARGTPPRRVASPPLLRSAVSRAAPADGAVERGRRRGGATINGKQRYAVNGVSYINPDTPLKIANYYKISGVFSVGTISDAPSGAGGAYLQTSVMGASYRDYVDIVFENSKNEVQSWHIDGYAFWVVGMDGGKWSAASRQSYNLRDAVSRNTVRAKDKLEKSMVVDNKSGKSVMSKRSKKDELHYGFYFCISC
ncbi:hypothetical protein ABZP36_034886 [Zizania latifolia]